ncbi:hypothetical protein IQ06DRAFT_84973 [Phaeosphaeriaceae sp. SRC1lsM3a]|nr:hypothetical protein IQ06DRAFT_84973 [Stagonospora sp. SRC1lsM3a]
MDDGPHVGHRSRDEPCHSYDLSDAVYGMFPSRATDTSVRRSRISSPAKTANKLKSAADIDTASPLTIKLSQSVAGIPWLPQCKRTRLQAHQMELHQSTCLNLNMAAQHSTESDLWILPDFDDWELDNDAQHQSTSKTEGEWAPLLRRAASSNRDRLRARLEGDGWDFVGGKYGEDEKTLQEAVTSSQESVDDEFDLVVLPVVKATC